MKRHTAFAWLFALAAILAGAMWPIREAIAQANVECKDGVCTLPESELYAMRNFIGQLLIVNRALREEAVNPKRPPICTNS
jgi:hypothetical protein